MKFWSKEFLFAIRGRATRSQYWSFFGLQLVGILLVLATTVVISQLGSLLSPGSLADGFVQVLACAAFVGGWILLTWINVCVSIKRLHDTGKSGAWLLLGLIPLAGLALIIILGCEAGTPGANRFGPAVAATTSKAELGVFA